MIDEQDKKTYDHNKGHVADQIALISELEHIRRHAIRAAASTWTEEDDSEAVRYLVIAKRAQTIRREYMRNHMSEIKEADWCLCKASASLRQLLYEVNEGWPEELKEIDDLIDDIWGPALDMDLSDCASCREDKEE